MNRAPGELSTNVRNRSSLARSSRSAFTRAVASWAITPTPSGSSAGPRTGKTITCQVTGGPPGPAGVASVRATGTADGSSARRMSASRSSGKSGTTSRVVRPTCSSTGRRLAAAR